MTLRSIFSEAWRNIRTGTTRAVLLAGVLAIASALLAVTDLGAISSLEHKAQEFRSSGAAIRILTAEGSIDAASCNALTSANTVGASGALAASAAVTADALPSGSIPAYTVSPSFSSVLGMDLGMEAGVWIPASLAETLHAEIGTVLQSGSGPLEISGIYDWPEDGRDSRLNYAFLIPDATRAVFDECWAVIWPTSAESEDLLRFAGAVDFPDTAALTLSQANKSFGTSFDGHHEYLTRITQFALPVSALVGLFIGFAGVRLRRLEYAGALHAGQRKLTTLATALVETVCWSGVALVIAAAALLVTSHLLSAHSALVLAATGVRTLTATTVGTLAGTVLAIALIRESHLFRYFKDR